jgi:hypothetical protein
MKPAIEWAGGPPKAAGHTASLPFRVYALSLCAILTETY